MTAIAAARHDGRVWIGGDSCGSTASIKVIRADRKVFRNRGYVIGFTSSFRIGQLLRYSFKPTQLPDRDVDRFMVTTFIDELRDCLQHGGQLRDSSGVHSGGSFLVGCGEHLFEIDSDFQVGRPLDDYAAVGSGGPVACGALHVLSHLEPATRVRRALEAAARNVPSVAGPFHVLSTTRRAT